MIAATSGQQRSPFEKFPEALENVFREGWTNNADAMSYLYTGTPALKTDFTRTGKRTKKGAFNDGVNSVTRYYINNFTDGYYHDCLDIATCQLTAKDELKPRRAFFTLFKLSIILTFTFTYLSHLYVEHHLKLHLNQDSLNTMILQIVIVAGTFIAGLYGISQSGRKFADDATRFV